jgi:hypothetical protein
MTQERELMQFVEEAPQVVQNERTVSEHDEEVDEPPVEITGESLLIRIQGVHSSSLSDEMDFIVRTTTYLIPVRVFSGADDKSLYDWVMANKATVAQWTKKPQVVPRPLIQPTAQVSIYRS